MSSEIEKYLAEINQRIRRGCTAHLTTDGRIYYMNHETKTSSLLPPVESWDSGTFFLPYGWETAVDENGKTYFINHVNKTTTYVDPRKRVGEDPPPEPRNVELFRDAHLGFGFVAGSEKPVIVRFVSEGGPSEHILLPGDQIIKINGEDVLKAPREHVIELIRSCKQSVHLTVCQPQSNNTTRKSALLTAAKKTKLKSKHPRVHFAEGVLINDSPLFSPTPFESCVPCMPNVLKVFLENYQTKSFKYDSTTTVQDVISSLHEKLSIQCPDHFGLIVEHIKSFKKNRLTLLDPKETLSKIAARPGAHNLRCLFRVTFVPIDAYDLLQKDPIAFEYLYVQCCNDVIKERLAPDLKYDVVLRLAALQIHQHAITSGIQGKLTIKAIEKECGLERFVPLSLLETMKRKELRKLLGHFMKQNQSLAAPGQKQLTALQAKLHYLKIISEHPGYGARWFASSFKDSTMKTTLLISPKFGISQVISLDNTSEPVTLAQIEEVSSLMLKKEDEMSYNVEIQIKKLDIGALNFNLEDKDTEELALLLQGYHHLLAGCDFSVHWDTGTSWKSEIAPLYHGRHTVQEAPWSYFSSTHMNQDDKVRTRVVDFTLMPPSYFPCELPPDRQIQRISSKEQFITMINRTTSVDHNMNKTLRSSEDFSIMKSDESRENEGDTRESEDGLFNFESVVSLQLFEDESDDIDLTLFEARKEEIIQKKSDMVNIVHNAKNYPTEDVPHEEDQFQMIQYKGRKIGHLKAVDSLLCLSKFDSQREEIFLNVSPKSFKERHPNLVVHSENESNSHNTPENNSLHIYPHIQTSTEVNDRSQRTGSSFGLHSPDMDGENNKLISMLSQLQSSSEIPLPFAERTFYLDPDIIDLTMIPPPVTIEQNTRQISSCANYLNNPPTPFHNNCFSVSMVVTDENTDVLKDTGKQDSHCNSISELSYQQDTIPHFVPESDVLPFSDDINTFIASVTVPPPPTESSTEDSLTYVNNHEDLSTLIIPPPPSSDLSTLLENEVIARFQQATADVQQMFSQNNNSDAEHTEKKEGQNCFFEEQDYNILEVSLKNSSIIAASEEQNITLMNHVHASSSNGPSVTQLSTDLPDSPDYTVEGDCHGSDSSGYETQTSSLTSYGEMLLRDFPVYQDLHEDHHTYADLEFISDPDYLNLKFSENPASKENHLFKECVSDYEEVHFKLMPKVMAHGLDASNTIHLTPKAPPRTKNLKHTFLPIKMQTEAFHSGGLDDIQSSTKKLDMTDDNFSSIVRSRSLINLYSSWNQVSSTDSIDKPLLPLAASLTLDCKKIITRSQESCQFSSKDTFDSEQKMNFICQANQSQFKYWSKQFKSATLGRKKYHDASWRKINGFTNDSLNNNLNHSIEDGIFMDDISEMLILAAPSHSYLAGDIGDTLLFGNASVCSRAMELQNCISPLESSSSISLMNHRVIPINSVSIALENSTEDASLESEQERNYYQAQHEIAVMILHLEDICHACVKTAETSVSDINKFTAAKEALITESRQFVTASKLFVKSATGSSDQMIEHLNICVALLDRIFTVTKLVITEMVSVNLIACLVEKLKDVAIAYSRTVNATHQTVREVILNSHLGILMHEATSLASALTSLMQTLRSFNSP
ncbi:uncharacterized protein LOC143255775 isoform X2 [Tachypleus tridentatus]|uniref:uncharacterized protein LOC143255775 isoform X2 n=1 Tax=Tachypleus tridentatus TaxID=6853 RepID=UPI003FD401EE